MRLSSVVSAAVLAVLTLVPASAMADSAVTDVDLHYKLYVGGAGVAKMDLAARIGEDKFIVSGQGSTIGFIDNFADMLFTGRSEGRIDGVNIVPAQHSHDIDQRGQRKRDVTIAYGGGAPKVTARPKFNYGSRRAPITEAMTRGTIDPVSSFVIPVKKGVSPLHPSQCQRAVAIFDGQQRFDVTLKHMASYGAYRVETANYTGPAIRCSVRMTAVGGHFKDGFFSFLAKHKNIDVALVPVGGNRFLVPLKYRFPTPLGQAVVQATRFNTTTTTQAAALGGN